MTQGMQAEVLGELCCLSSFSEGPTDRVGIRRNESPRLSGEGEGSVGRATPASAASRPVPSERSELRQRGLIDGDLPNARPCLGRLDHRTAVGGNDSLIDRDDGPAPIDVRPPERTGLPSPDSGCGNDAEADRISRIELLRLLQKESYLFRSRSADRFPGIGEGQVGSSVSWTGWVTRCRSTFVRAGTPG